MSKDLSPASVPKALEQGVYQAVMDHAPWPMVEVEGSVHLVRSVNAAFCKLLKKPSEDIIGKPLAELVPQDKSILPLLDRVSLTGEAEAHAEAEHDAPHPVFWSYTCWPLQVGNARRIGLMIQVTETGVFHQQATAMNEALLISAVQQHELTDVAERLNVRLQNEIVERRKAEVISDQLASIVAFSDDAIIGKDLDGIITSWNNGAEKIFGYAASEMVGNSILRLLPADRHKEEDLILGKIRLGESVQHFETVRLTKDGRAINVSVTASPIRDASGKVIGASKVSRDITVRKRLESTLAQTAKDLAEMDRRKSEFLATLAHELRNPLAPLRIGLELLALAEHDQATWDRAHAMMKRQLDQMVLLIDDLMDLSRITRGVIDLRKERLDLRTLLDQSVETARPFVERQEHTLVLDLPDLPVLIEGDAMRLAQVFSNLLNNAAKYTDRGGAIAVHLDVDDQEATVVIEDNGIGIAPEQIQRVFDMFAQVERSNDRVQGGLGIGLNIVKHLVGMHGGRIGVLSEGLGKGSTFSVVLPLMLRAPVEPQVPSREQEVAIATPKRILVVDDNEDAAAMMAMLLKKMGHEVRVAHNGEEGLEAGATLLPQVVLMDLGMPVMDGCSACRLMRGTDWGKEALIIALSGWGQEEDRHRSAEAGFDHHLVKPIASAEVFRLIATAATPS